MPELPEVETIRRGLELVLPGQVITKVDQRRKDLRVPFPDNLVKRLTGRTVTHLTRRAKYILIHLDDGNMLVLHMGMSGRMLIVRPEEAYDLQKHDHLILTMEDGARIIFNDPRRFGMVLLVHENEIETHKAFAALGPEPLDNGFSAPVLAARLKDRKSPIKQALLDQRIVVGVGNIYACESLFEAGIGPTRLAGSVKAEEIEKLTAAIRNVLSRAIEAGGSSLKDYRQADGELGYFQHSFSVYDREKMACPGCTCDIDKTGGVQRIVQSGRSTFYCPQKQR